MSGSGKTTLLNNLILGIGEQYSPQEVQLFLMDYKDGVEFQAFRDHPHCARIFLDNTDRDAATRLLEEFAATIAQRGALFREEGGAIKDLEAYNARYPDAPLPRLLLIIDEAQELFGNQWRATQHFNELLKQVVKKGRAFGVHVILSTQTLLTSNIDRELMTQINLRIAFKLNNSGDCDRILSFGNDAPLRLQRFDLVLNDDSGLKARNRIGRCAPPRDIAAVVAEIRRKLPAELRRQPEIVASAGGNGTEATAGNKSESVALGELPGWAAGTGGKEHASKARSTEPDDYASQRALLASVEKARQRALDLAGEAERGGAPQASEGVPR
jgi:DNA segregation ATPase FtsK/SpoIIIE-like protein